MTLEALDCARTIFDFLQLPQEPESADVMLVFGTNDARVPAFAAELYHRGLAETVLVTGGMAHQDDLLATGWTRPEADVYRDILIHHGVPSGSILLEPCATNTAENLRFSRRLLDARGIRPDKLLMISKPFMQRRVFATHAVEWPQVPASLASWRTTFDEYCTLELSPEKVTHIMMGDLQRVWVYAQRGWSAHQEIPGSVMAAFLTLKRLGYTRQLLPENGNSAV